ncbi:MAG: hypothetical protein ACOX2F_04675 [bacterium]
MKKHKSKKRLREAIVVPNKNKNDYDKIEHQNGVFRNNIFGVGSSL